MDKCNRCGNKFIGYVGYYCNSCKDFLAGNKPRKSRDLCNGCTQDFYNNKYRNTKNMSGDKGCMNYKNSKVKIMKVYYSNSQVIPNIAWKLNCFNYKRS